jgi:hypothetical protein
MKEIRIEPTEKSPRIYFSPTEKKFEIEGNSRPENVRDFYYPILGSLREYFEEISKTENLDTFNEYPLKFSFKFEYFNSSSAKFISDILLLIATYHRKGVSVRIYWHFEQNDEDMQEVGEEFSKMIDIPFQMVMISKK